MKNFMDLSVVLILALFPYSSYAEPERTSLVELVEIPDNGGCVSYQSGYRPYDCDVSSSYTIFSEAKIPIYFNILYTNQRGYEESWRYFRIDPNCKWRFHCGSYTASVSYDKAYHTPGVQENTIIIELGKEYKFVLNATTGVVNLVENQK